MSEEFTTSSMRRRSLMLSMPILIFIFLAIAVLLLPSLVIPCWYHTTKIMKENVDSNFHQFHSAVLSEVDNTAKALHPLNSSASDLAGLIVSSLNETQFSTFEIENKTAPFLFQAFSTVPLMSQISYIGLEGPFFSYYLDGNQTYAMYSSNCTWYKQLVDPSSGKLYGDAVEAIPFIVNNSNWVMSTLNSTRGYASFCNGSNSVHDPLLLNTVGVYQKGVISLGFSLKAVMDFFNGIQLYGGSMYMSTQQGDVLVGGLPNTQMVVNGKSVSFNLVLPSGDHNQSVHVGDVSCLSNDGNLRASMLNFGTAKYTAYCSALDIVGVQSVYALVFPCDGVVSTIHRTSRIALILLVVMIGAVIIFILTFVLLMVGAKTREMHLCAALIKQMEATQQAERKSMNKSLAFASASHDIRAALAGITGLIEICYEEAKPGSELEINLQQMDGCTKDLLGLLNSILDTSKIEAGKMQLEEEEFDLANLLEDVVDLFHPVAMKKGVDLVLDPCDGSILKFSQVKGDRGKLKQVLCNLLSNAVKFTSEGHISVRSWAQKPRAENDIIHSGPTICWKHCSCLFYKNKEEYDQLENLNTAIQNPKSIEVVFEVDDTGAGIPKEKQKSVFENFVQVKETALGQGGTGLGLGIVQSLVRLMGGEIGIVDKQNGERGTCFKFNVFLTTTSETPSNGNNSKADIEMAGGDQYQGLTIRTNTSCLTVRSTSPRLSILSPSPKVEGSVVVLLLKNEERRRTTQKFMESLGIKVVVVNQWENLYSTLIKVKSKHNISPHGSSGKSDSGLASKDVPLSVMDGIEQQNLPSYSSPRGPPGFVLLVIDASAGQFQDIYKIVSDFRRSLSDACCKVVWLDRPTSHLRSLAGDEIDTSDDIFLKPFHGSRLYQVIRLLPEFRTTLSSHGVSTQPKKEKSPCSSSAEHSHKKTEIRAEGSSNSEAYRKRVSPSKSFRIPVESESTHAATKRHPEPSISDTKEKDGNLSNAKPLSGMKFLVADDNALLRKLAWTNLIRLGAEVELCANGEEALELVRISLHNQAKHSNPYDYILMDCEMPVMNGYEAARQIRKLEKDGIHIPIIALTAHTSGSDADKTAEAGMDVHLAKPLNKDNLLDAIRYIHSK